MRQMLHFILSSLLIVSDVFSHVFDVYIIDAPTQIIFWSLLQQVAHSNIGNPTSSSMQH